jgi:hypothetical protein
MVCFQTKNPNLGKSCNERYWYILWTIVHVTVFCYIVWTFGIVHGNLVNFSRFGILYQEKSGNPGDHAEYGKFKSRVN